MEDVPPAVREEDLETAKSQVQTQEAGRGELLSRCADDISRACANRRYATETLDQQQGGEG